MKLLFLNKNQCKFKVKSMGNNQNQASSLYPKSVLLQNWSYLQNSKTVLLNKTTNEQILQHQLYIPKSQIQIEVGILASRMHDHHPFICRIIYYHPINISTASQNPNIKEYYVYTDRVSVIREAMWSRDRTVSILKGLRKLVQVYGGFIVGQQMLCQNQRKQVKLWINSNPVSNHKETEATELQTLLSFSTILMRKNQELGKVIANCQSFIEAIQKTSNYHYKQFTQFFHNYIHSDIQKDQKDNDSITKKYKNVFNQTDKQNYKLEVNNLHEVRTPSRVQNPKDQQQKKQPVLIRNISMGLNFNQTSKIGVNKNQMSAVVRMNGSPSKYESVRQHTEVYNYKIPSKTINKNSSFQNSANSSFQTPKSIFKNPANNFSNNNNISNDNCFTSPPNSPYQCSEKDSSWQNTNNAEFIKKPFDITIINNNINNYITPEGQYSIQLPTEQRNNASNYSSAQNKQEKEKPKYPIKHSYSNNSEEIAKKLGGKVPQFIKQKINNNNNNNGFQLSGCAMNSPKSKMISPKYQPGMDLTSQKQRLSSYNFKNVANKVTTTFERSSNMAPDYANEVKIPNRTKTTEFGYKPYLNNPFNNSTCKNKSFNVEEELEKNKIPFPSFGKKDKPLSNKHQDQDLKTEQISSFPKTSQSIEIQQKGNEVSKLEIKKQRKFQFQSILGSKQSQKQQFEQPELRRHDSDKGMKQHIRIKSSAILSEDPMRNDVSIKEKIQKKKAMMANVKKQMQNLF